LARSIQKRLLPPRELDEEGYSLAARNEAASYVAGDYFDIFSLSNGDLSLVVADVAGKGIGASLIMASTKAVLPFIANENTVGGALSALNERLVLPRPARVRSTLLRPFLRRRSPPRDRQCRPSRSLSSDARRPR
jgi:serine phosphatase RsbU (regulator of sigma subunit)